MTATVPPSTVDLTVPQPLERGYTLPAHWYTDPAIFALEKARILQRFWQYVGYVEQVARPGDFFTSTVDDVPIVVLRDEDGAVRDSAKEGKGDGIYDVSGDKLSEGVREGCFSMIFPTTMLVINPGPHNLGILSLFPLDEQRTVERRDTFFSPAVPDEDVQAMVDFSWQVLQEDITLCESVQRGLRSGFFDQGRLIVSRENGIQHFQQLVHRVLAGE